VKTLVGKTTFWIASTLATPLLWGQNNNDATLNNGGDVIFSYSDPALGGDLYWRAHTGANMMNDTSGPLGAPVQTMEVDGYFESIFDTDWTTTPIFYDREHVPVVGGLPVLGGGTLVVIGPSGLGPPAAGCPPVGFVDGYIVDIAFGATPGSGVVLPADGTPGSDTATVWHVGAAGCIVTTPLCPPGACGAGDYTLQDVHSTNETQADIGGTGLNPSGGFQIAGGGLGLEAVTSMAEGNETWRGNLVQVVAASSGGAGVEVALNGGGAMNGRALPVSAGGATLGIEIRDSAATGGPNIAIAGASLTKIPGPGAFVGAWLKVIPDGLFNSTSALWTGSVAAIVFALGPEGAYTSPQLPVPPTAAGATLNIQGATFDLGSFIVDNTNVVTTALF
jgi:hypothetical protein